MVSVRLRFAVPLLLAACPALLNGCQATDTDRASATADFGVRGAVLRLNPNPAAPSAAYFTLAAGNQPRVLTGATSTDVDRIELHEAMMSAGMTSMAPLAHVAVAAHSDMVFRPGGRHMMLFGLSPRALAAGQLTINLQFAGAPPLPVQFAFAPSRAGADSGAGMPPRECDAGPCRADNPPDVGRSAATP